MTNEIIHQIRTIVDAHHTQYGKFLRRPENKHLLDFIEQYEQDKLKDNNLQTKIYWILNGIHDYIKCHNPNCPHGGIVKSNVRNLFTGYGTEYPTCCSACAKHTPEYLKNWGDSIESKYGEGIRHPMHSPVVKAQVREVTEERWGGIGFASPELNAKERAIFKEKYGTDDPGNLPENREKARQTSMNNFGVDNPMKNDEVKQKVENTNIKRYGAKSFLLTEKGQKRSKQTMIEQHGSVKQAYKERHEKTKQTKKERYGDENYNNPEQIVKTQIKLYGGLWGNKTYVTSKGEKEVLEYVKSIYNGTIIENDRTQMEPNSENNWLENHELDIWLPDIKVAIEYNGTYWHSLPNIVESDHFKKLQCESKGISLISISEQDWTDNPERCKMTIRSHIGK